MCEKNLTELSQHDQSQLVRSPDAQVQAMEAAHVTNKKLLQAFEQIVRGRHRRAGPRCQGRGNRQCQPSNAVVECCARIVAGLHARVVGGRGGRAAAVL